MNSSMQQPPSAETCTRDELETDPRVLVQVCGLLWGSHNDHTCSVGRKRGSWAVKGKGGPGDGSQNIKLLTSLLEGAPPVVQPLPAERAAMYSGVGSLKEDKRLNLWRLGVSVTEDPDKLIDFVDGQQPWSLGESEDLDDAPSLMREASSGIQSLSILRELLDDLE